MDRNAQHWYASAAREGRSPASTAVYPARQASRTTRQQRTSYTPHTPSCSGYSQAVDRRQAVEGIKRLEKSGLVIEVIWTTMILGVVS